MEKTQIDKLKWFFRFVGTDLETLEPIKLAVLTQELTYYLNESYILGPTIGKPDEELDKLLYKKIFKASQEPVKVFLVQKDFQPRR